MRGPCPDQQRHPPTGRLARLHVDLLDLAGQLRKGIGSAVGDAVAGAVADAVVALLGGRAESRPPGVDPLGWGDDSWPEGDYHEADPFLGRPASTGTPTAFVPGWGPAGLAWLARQATRRPVLAVAVAVLTAGAAVLFARPVLVGGAGLVASAAGLVLASDAAVAVVGRLAPMDD